MKAMLLAAALATTAALATPALAGVDVGVSVQISQPGVYGRIDIGRYPQPVLVAPQPVWIARPVQAPPVQPIYMWVPPGHQKNWRKHCAHYGACGAPVYFVQERWYHQHVNGPEHGRGHGRGDGRGDDRRDGRGDGRGDDRGHGTSEGRGHGKGHDKRD
jgi:hypothetical protein